MKMIGSSIYLKFIKFVDEYTYLSLCEEVLYNYGRPADEVYYIYVSRMLRYNRQRIDARKKLYIINDKMAAFNNLDNGLDNNKTISFFNDKEQWYTKEFENKINPDLNVPNFYINFKEQKYSNLKDIDLNNRDLELEEILGDDYYVFKDDYYKYIQIVKKVYTKEYFNKTHAFLKRLEILNEQEYTDGCKQFGNKQWLMTILKDVKVNIDVFRKYTSYTYYTYLMVLYIPSKTVDTISIGTLDLSTTQGSLKRFNPGECIIDGGMKNIELTNDDLEFIIKTT